MVAEFLYPDLELSSQKEGFVRTPWVEEALSQIEKLGQKQTIEFKLPDDIDPLFFISELGRPARPDEFGGLYNPINRSMILRRGSESALFDSSSARVDFMSPRINPDGKTTDDIFFHTHPWKERNMIQYYNVPENSCRPSDTDKNNVMNTRMIEQEDGFERTVVSIIGSRGHISITTSTGVKVNDAELLSAGVSESQLQTIKEKLDLVPPDWISNSAKDDNSKPEVIRLVNEFYKKRQTDTHISYKDKVTDLKKAISPYIRSESLEKFIDSLMDRSPEYPNDSFLRTQKLTKEQIKMFQEMSGIKISIYKVEEGKGVVPID